MSYVVNGEEVPTKKEAVEAVFSAVKEGEEVVVAPAPEEEEVVESETPPVDGGNATQGVRVIL